MEPPQTHRITSQDAESALERAPADADWLASLRDAYAGRHDVLDALWWVAHPLTDTPSGKGDPAAALRDLQRAAFSREAAQSPVTEVVDPDGGGVLRMRESEHRLWQLQRLLAEDARFLAQACATVRPTAEAASDADGKIEVPTFVEVSRQRDAVQEHEFADETEAQSPLDQIAAPARRVVLPVLVGVGLLAAILVFPTLPGLDAGADPAPTPTTPTSTPHVREEVVMIAADGNVTDPLTVLARPHAEGDEPTSDIVDSFAAGSFRRLPDLVGFLELYLARNGQGDSICLIAVRQDGASQGTCVRDAEFAEQGIQVGNSGDRYQVGASMTILSESISLLANGDFHYEARARAPLTDTGSGDVVFPSSDEQFLGTCASCEPQT